MRSWQVLEWCTDNNCVFRLDPTGYKIRIHKISESQFPVLVDDYMDSMADSYLRACNRVKEIVKNKKEDDS